jgi:hypothetical protein
MVFSNLVKKLLENGGTIIPIYIKNEDSKGTGLCNASILYTEGKLRMILRNVEYTLYHSEGEQKYQSCYEGPLSYYHRDDDLKLRTHNFYCEINPDDLSIENYTKIDMSAFDKNPVWTFIGLEDARLVFWDNKYYACGVRRDTRTNGQGRMELSELKIDNLKDSSKGQLSVKEIARHRIEVPDYTSYCEKNWMPLRDKAFHFIKWTIPTELVRINLNNNTSESLLIKHNKDETEQLHKLYDIQYELRGGSHLIPWYDNTYIAIVHECKFIPKNFNGYKDADYYHRFVIWNEDMSIKFISNKFNFMTGKTEFCIGMEEVPSKDTNNPYIVIVFGFQDNACYVVKILKEKLNEIIWKELSNV